MKNLVRQSLANGTNPPTVYNRWCNCEVDAQEIIAHDPTNQNIDYRISAYDAFFDFLEDQANANQLYVTGTAPYNLYNGVYRYIYQKGAAGLQAKFTDMNGLIDYEGGSRASLDLKVQVRNATLPPQRYVLDKIDPIKATTKATPRFWRTNVGWNAVGKLGVASGFVGLGVAVVRITTADDKLHETGKVVSGFGGAYLGMQMVAPLAAMAGAASGPAAPFVAGGILFVGGVAGAMGAEWVYDQF